jgi:uncharacterized membrane protein YeaQ/YmgE (transglycosylase-associated protein family)
MNTTFSYGLIYAAGNIVLTLVGFFLGFQTDKMAEGTWFGWLTFVAAIVVTWLGVKAVREESADKSLRYGKGVASGFLINLYAGVIGAIYGFIHFTFINPSFTDYAINLARQKAANANDAQLAAMEKYLRFAYSPTALSIMGIVFAMIIGIVLALIVSAFLKRQPPAAIEEAPPAV